MANKMLKTMTQAKTITVATLALFALAACGNEKPEEQAAGDGAVDTLPAPDLSHKTRDPELEGAVVTPGSPYRVTYEIIGTPIVGSPITVELKIESASGSRPVLLEYRIRDASSMMLAESQPARVLMEPAQNEKVFKQKVTVIPQREGRFYLNVSASFETSQGTTSTVTAIPIQVGSGTRELQENGEVQVDENGEAVRILTSDQK
jgi:hypothetical protein